jgi:uncharacterized protein (TIRG00374 family)
MQPESKRKARRILIFLLKSGIAALLLFLLLRKTQYKVFAQQFRGILWGWAIGAALLHIIGYLVSAHRWRILLRAQGLTPSLWELIKSYIVATFFNYVLLGTVGGDISRAYDTGVKSKRGAEAVSAVLVERVTGVAAMMFLAGAGILFLLIGPARLSVSAFWNVQAAVATCAAMFLFLFAVLLILFHPRVVRVIVAKLDRPSPLFGKLRKIFMSLHSALMTYRSNPAPIYKNLLWALVLQLNVTLHYFFLGLAMGLPLFRYPLHSFCSYMVVVPAITLILMVPLTPGGAGVREWTLGELRGGLGFAGTSSGIASAVLLGWLQVATVLLYGLIGFLILTLRMFKVRSSRGPSPDLQRFPETTDR